MNRISTADNALDSIHRLQRDLAGADHDPLSLKGALQWGWHAVACLAHHRLRPEKERLGQWFWAYLEAGEPELDVERDARWEERQRLSLLELLDVFSEEELPLLKPEFYQGWQDRTSRCRTLRQRIAEATGTCIGDGQRQRLLLLLAAYHRLLRLPASVDLDPATVRSAFPALLDLLEVLVNQSHDHASALLEAITGCRKAVG